MSDNISTIRDALSDIVRPDELVGIKENGGKVLLTVAVNVPMGEKPAFADRLKTAAKGVEGVKDVFVSFAEPPQKAADQPGDGPAVPNPLDKIDRIIAVGAGKGGVGKSTVSVNLAISLAKRGLKVGLLDADIYGPSAAIMTGCSDHEAKGDEYQRIVPAMRHGVRVVSMLCSETFASQSEDYRNRVIPADAENVFWVEAGYDPSGYCFARGKGLVIGLSDFGISAPGKELADHFGFTPEKVAKKVRNQLA